MKFIYKFLSELINRALENVIKICGVSILVGFIFLWFIAKLENFPTFCVSVVALGFSYLAYYNSREKFRLDLFEKRYESYRNCMKFCSYLIQFGGLPDYEKDSDARKDVELIAAQSFRGEGYHLATFLFGKDVAELYGELNKIYAFFSAHPDYVIRQTPDNGRVKEIMDMKFEHIRYMNDILNRMPEIFSKYMNFSRY